MNYENSKGVHLPFELNNDLVNNIVSLSGGKDSTAMLLMMLERTEPIHSVVFFDTGWEFPEMGEHIDKLEKYVGLEFIRLKPLQPFDFLLSERVVPKSGTTGKPRTGYGWPSPLRRWCTGRKLDIIKKYYNSQNDFISCIGFAADEAKRVPVISKKKYPERYPLIEYDVSEQEALEYCYDKGFDWGGLYELFGRVSCFCCPLKRIGDYRNLRKFRPELWGRMLMMDDGLGDDRGFLGFKTVRDLDRRFAEEDRQIDLFETVAE
jgi:3'-phosphoadenosine 5'-phosphosulfate sulfotransferase (PAPS reductase)/FAD synthetase